MQSKNASVEGFRHLFGALNLDTTYWSHRDNDHVRLDAHPFDLNTVVDGERVQQYFLVAFPGYTDVSVHNMVLMLQEAMQRIATRGRFRLRIIRVPIGKDHSNPNRLINDLYFELLGRHGSFLCGGCNDYSGEGGSGGKRMEAIFTAVGALCNIPVEQVVIRRNSHAVNQDLCDLYNESMHRRSLQVA